MQDIKNNLKKPEVSVCFETASGILTYEGRGLRPLLTAINERKEDLKGSSAADKIVGRAAALLFAYAGVKSVYAALISQSGAQTLEEYGIEYSYSQKAPFIENRDKTGMCPMEQKSLLLKTPKEAFIFFNELIQGVAGNP